MDAERKHAYSCAGLILGYLTENPPDVGQRIDSQWRLSIVDGSIFRFEWSGEFADGRRWEYEQCLQMDQMETMGDWERHAWTWIALIEQKIVATLDREEVANGQS